VEGGEEVQLRVLIDRAQPYHFLLTIVLLCQLASLLRRVPINYMLRCNKGVNRVDEFAAASPGDEYVLCRY
jgi:hypothetical protein